MELDANDLFASHIPQGLRLLNDRELLHTLISRFGDAVTYKHIIRLEEIARLPEADRKPQIERLIESFRFEPSPKSVGSNSETKTKVKRIVF